MGDLLISQVLMSRKAIHLEEKMTTDERTPGPEIQNEENISQNLLMQVKVVGGIVFLVLLAVFFGVI